MNTKFLRMKRAFRIIFKQKIDIMINQLFTVAPWRRAVFIVPVLLFSLFSLHAQEKLAQDSIIVKGVIFSGTNMPLSNIKSVAGNYQRSRRI
jgi:hypothetical protein